MQIHPTVKMYILSLIFLITHTAKANGWRDYAVQIPIFGYYFMDQYCEQFFRIGLT